LGPIPEGAEVNHRDGDGTNNAEPNLEYVTRRVNIQHAIEVTGAYHGEGHSQSKLTLEAVQDIRANCPRTQAGFAEYARRYGVALTTVANVVYGQTWRSVPCP
jgi:hypothetical protein